MADVILRDAVEADFERIIEINAAEVVKTSAMDADRLRFLHELAGYHKVAVVDGHVAAFLLAMPDGVDYPNDNYGWFAARHPRFLYVDRIVVDSAFSGLGIGSRMYRDLFGYARAQQIGTVACEYNIEPPNHASRKFHDKFGFREVGTQYVADGTKRVSMQVVEV
jgi:predicted GNAT superfamily acetyltransferase